MIEETEETDERRDQLEAEVADRKTELARYESVLDLVRPIMEANPGMTLRQALEHWRLWPEAGRAPAIVVLPPDRGQAN